MIDAAKGRVLRPSNLLGMPLSARSPTISDIRMRSRMREDQMGVRKLRKLD